jgi:hypothetical protein
MLTAFMTWLVVIWPVRLQATKGFASQCLRFFWSGCEPQKCVPLLLATLRKTFLLK